MCSILAPAFAMPLPDIIASSSSFALDPPLQVFLARTPDLLARTPYMFFSNI
jgi:hypothetical protein